ncbi:MAG: FAD-binding oxidoreductase [Candidatus Zixiibacteriota bacterium]|nr:MAG: FAD-binding oxidoreductase [candidate division Zixibacteria bacterium]
MIGVDRFIERVNGEFPGDRVTYQKSLPTFHPQSGDEAARLFGLATEMKQQLYITGFGNNISPEGEKFKDLVVIRTDRLNQLVRVMPEDFYVVAGAGYPLKELNLRLKKHNLFFPHADLPYVGSVGGALATGLTADYGGHDLPISRYFIMAEIGLPGGKLIKPGSACFKSVSGFDIVKIFSPSWGLLGLIVTACLRVLPTSLAEDYAGLKMQSIEYEQFVDLFQNPGDNVSAQYSLKIKSKFDPQNNLPLIDIFH